MSGMKAREGHVYVLERHGLVKVGRSHRPAIRAYQQGALPMYISSQIQRHACVERAAHELLRHHRVGLTEWLNVTLADAVLAVMEAQMRVANDPTFSPVGQECFLTIRVDKEFVRAVDALRKAIDPMPSKSEMIRRAVFETFERSNGKSERKRASGR